MRSKKRAAKVQQLIEPCKPLHYLYVKMRQVFSLFNISLPKTCLSEAVEFAICLSERVFLRHREGKDFPPRGKCFCSEGDFWFPALELMF